MNQFQALEDKGRKLFAEILNQYNLKGKPTADNFDRSDYDFSDHYTAEIKVRYKDYPTWQMELSKLYALCAKVK